MREFWRQYNASLGSFPYLLLKMWRDRRSGQRGDATTDTTRVHLFAGPFASEEEMFAYCFTPVTAHGPEQINLDLPEASVDTSRMDAVMGDLIAPRLSEYFDTTTRKRILRQLKPSDALILIPMAALNDVEFRLHDTPRLRHLGFEKRSTTHT
jgi:hypothetical protein